MFAYPLLILFETNSAAKTGFAAAAVNVGTLATMLVGGVLADRYSRRTLLRAGPVVQGIAVGSVGIAVAAGHVWLAHVAAAGFVDGAMLGLTRGSINAAFRRLVTAEQYPSAAAQMHARDMSLGIIGPLLGGVLFAWSRALPFILDAVSYVAAFFGVSAIRRPLGPEAAES